MSTIIDRFRTLHAEGIFVMPNPYDLGSARLLAALGFPALASTSSGFAATLGRLDMTVSRDELLAHVGPLAAATDLPLNVDSERCFADDLAGVSESVELLAAAGAAGCSIEDWNPLTASIDPLDVADRTRRRGSGRRGCDRARADCALREPAPRRSTISTTPSPGCRRTPLPEPMWSTPLGSSISIRSRRSSMPCRCR